MTPTDSKQTLDATLSALADPHRRAVIDLLKSKPRRAGEIADSLSLTPAALSRHLRVLRRCRLIHIDPTLEETEKDARVRVYTLRKEPFDEMRVWLNEVENYWVGELTAFRDHVAARKHRSGLLKR